MPLNTVTLQWDLTNLVQAGMSATLSIWPTDELVDGVDHVIVPSQPAVTVTFANGTGSLAGIVANDNANISPSTAGYLISVALSTGQVVIPEYEVKINFANGASQWLDDLVPVPPHFNT